MPAAVCDSTKHVQNFSKTAAVPLCCCAAVLVAVATGLLKWTVEMKQQ